MINLKTSRASAGSMPARYCDRAHIMIIRCEDSRDYPAVAFVNRLAFAGDLESKLIEEIRVSNHYIPELSLVAEVDGVVRASILFSYIDLVGDETGRVLGLAPLAVLPQFQRQGIGSALVTAGLEKADVMGEALVVVLGNPRFYSRFGFRPSVVYGIESPFSVPEEVFMVKTLRNYEPRYKGKVVYPPAFHVVLLL